MATERAEVSPTSVDGPSPLVLVGIERVESAREAVDFRGILRTILRNATRFDEMDFSVQQ